MKVVTDDIESAPKQAKSPADGKDVDRVATISMLPASVGALAAFADSSRRNPEVSKANRCCSRCGRTAG